MRKNVKKDLDEAVEGDLRFVELGDNMYDVIYSSFVLEHIQGAERVLGNFVKWLKPGGIMVIQIPDPYSVDGFVTRITPHWFHTFFYRYVLGDQNAGKPGYGPYPTYYDPVVSREGIRSFCRQNNLEINAEYGDGYNKRGVGATRMLIGIVKQILRVVSLGRLSAAHINLLYVLKKKSTVGCSI